MTKLSELHMSGRYGAYVDAEIPEALAAVSIINDELFAVFANAAGGDDKVDIDLLNLVCLEYVGAGNCETVLFLGRNLWDDQNDPREVDESLPGCQYTPLLVDFLRQEMRNTIAALAPIHQLGQPKA